MLGVLALSALGLLVAGAITYTEQKSFLQDRLDQQARAAMPAVSHQLSARGVNVPGYSEEPDGYGRGPGGPGRGPDAAAANLPPGTYGERRDSSGQVLGAVVLSYGEDPLAAPDIPADLAPGEVVTVASRDGSLKYRATGQETQGQPGTTVVAVPMAEMDRTLDRLMRVEAFVIGGVLLALALISWLIVRLGLRPLDRIGDTAGAIAAGDLSQRVSPATPSTEVGRLGMALNEMLDRLERAFAEREASEAQLRQFLADASHELRTPLSSIRGYAELFRIGASHNATDTQKAMRRIEQEAERMGVLVEDMLTLARLDEVRDVVREDVDLGGLAHDAVADARATDPNRVIELRTDGAAIVPGDPDQLRQVLANLLRNALQHTPPGTAIDVSVAPRDQLAALEVRDHGAGLPSSDPDALFERFWRAQKGRERGRAGAGLGLAIVAGIVAAHGGKVAAENVATGGARFIVELPAHANLPAVPA